MRLTLVGPMRVVVDDHPVAVHGLKPQALLAAVSLSPRPPSREWLCALLWPEADASRAAAALRTTLWRLRVALGGADALRSDDRSVALDRTVCSCDVDDLDVIRSTPSLEDDTLGRVQSTLAALTAGELIHGMTGDNLQLEDWIEQQRRCWRHRVQTELDRLCLALLASGRFCEAVTVARLLVDRQPLCEAAHRRLIECQIRMGDSAAAHVRTWPASGSSRRSSGSIHRPRREPPWPALPPLAPFWPLRPHDHLLISRSATPSAVLLVPSRVPFVAAPTVGSRTVPGDRSSPAAVTPL